MPFLKSAVDKCKAVFDNLFAMPEFGECNILECGRYAIAPFAINTIINRDTSIVNKLVIIIIYEIWTNECTYSCVRREIPKEYFFIFYNNNNKIKWGIQKYKIIKFFIYNTIRNPIKIIKLKFKICETAKPKLKLLTK
jgi:hypothetical protein